MIGGDPFPASAVLVAYPLPAAALGAATPDFTGRRHVDGSRGVVLRFEERTGGVVDVTSHAWREPVEVELFLARVACAYTKSFRGKWH